MKTRIAIAIAFTAIALSACPREQTPPHDAAPAAEPATVAPAQPASIAPAASTEPRSSQGKGMRAPPPEPDPLIPPPPPPPVDR